MQIDAKQIGLVLGGLALAMATTCGGKVTVDEATSGSGGSGEGGSGTGNGTQSSNNGGVGNASSQVASTNVAVGTAVSATTNDVSVGVGGSSPGCTTCGEVLEGNGDPGDLCPQSAKLFQVFIDCICQNQCAMQCSDACSGGNPDMQCQQCIQNQCGNELQDCFNDA